MNTTRAIFLMILFFGVLSGLPAVAQDNEIHGADSIFAADGLAVVWGVLRGEDEESTLVHVKIEKSAPGAEAYNYYSVQAVDPFTGEARLEVPVEILLGDNLIRRPRSAFQYFSTLRLYFYTCEESARRNDPLLTIYYLGVPDTTPEFTSSEDLEEYFKGALQRLSD